MPHSNSSPLPGYVGNYKRGRYQRPRQGARNKNGRPVNVGIQFLLRLEHSGLCTQNAHGLWRKATDEEGNYLRDRPRDTTRFEHLISTMAKKQIDAYFIQETWIEGDDFDTEVGGYHVFRHNGPLGSNLHRGVAIVLSPRYYAGWKAAGGKDPIVLAQEDEFVGRIIGLTIKLECRNSRGRKIKGGKQKRNSLVVSLVSAYHPCHSDDEYSRFLDKMDTALQKLPRGEIVIGADINANIGVSTEENKLYAPTLGPHGIRKQNSKGKNILELYMSHDLRVMNTHYTAKEGVGYGTWTNIPRKDGERSKPSMLDVMVCSSGLQKRVQNCKVVEDGLESDHRAVRMEMILTSIKFKENSTAYGGSTDWRKIMTDTKYKACFNKNALALTSANMDYDDFNTAILDAGKATIVTIKERCQGWYEFSKNDLMPIIEEKNRLVHTLRHADGIPDTVITSLKCHLKRITKHVKDMVLLAKSRWYSSICGRIHDMRMNPRLAWENIRTLTGGESAHHKRVINMAMKLQDGSLATNSKENMSVFAPHFANVYNNHRPVDFEILHKIKQREVLTSIDSPITYEEVNAAINKLNAGKEPGLNGVPPEALKAMGTEMRQRIHEYVAEFFEGKVDHEGWHRSQCVPVPKKGDLSDPNKWRGVMLMDVSSKVFSSIMNSRAFQLLELHGTRFQFGGTPEIGCRDGLFTLKTLLNARRNHDLPSFVGFVDLVKAYDTANHELLLSLLGKYGAPPKFAGAVRKIYSNNVVVLKTEKEIEEFRQGVGVRQGDNMAPVLFLFLMTAFAGDVRSGMAAKKHNGVHGDDIKRGRHEKGAAKRAHT